MTVSLSKCFHYQSWEVDASKTATQIKTLISQITNRLGNLALSSLKEIGEFCYKGSLLHALDNERLERETLANQSLSVLERCRLGVKAGAHRVLQLTLLHVAVTAIALPIIGVTVISITGALVMPTLFQAVIVAPILEELIFRGFFQNIIKISQDTFYSYTTLNWLSSPSCRVLGSAIPFAAVHLLNAGVYLTTAQAIIQATYLILFPSFSILYEITGHLDTCIVAHATNNLIFGAPLLFLEHS